MTPLASAKNMLRLVAISFGLAQCAVARNAIEPDARSYIEVARAYLHHDWATAINAYWSPLYSWIVAFVLGITNPSLRWEYPTLHLLNFFIFIVGIIAFEYFWAGLLRSVGSDDRIVEKEHGSRLPDLELWILGYALFIWLTVGSVVQLLNPDLCVVVAGLFIAGTLVRLRKDDAPTRTYFWFGVALGIGYLCKGVLFPMAFVFLALAVVLRWRQLSRVAISLLVFSSIALPLILVLSHAKGHPTFGESGKLTFAWSNYDLPTIHWQGQPPGSGTPAHPLRKVFDNPAMFEFNGPVRSSYPPWYDPSYWNEGMSPGLRMGTVAKHFARNFTTILSFFFKPKVWLVVMLILGAGCRPRATLGGIAAFWYLILPSAAALAAYSMTFAEFRYLPVWLLLVWGSVLRGIRLRNSFHKSGAGRYVSILAAVALLAPMGYGIYGQGIHGRQDDARSQYAIAERLREMGVSPGENVGAVGWDNDVHWAYLDRLTVVAEIETGDTCRFWEVPSSTQQEILRKFADAGADVIVVNADKEFKSTSRSGLIDLGTCARPGPEWREIVGTTDLAYFLRQRR